MKNLILYFFLIIFVYACSSQDKNLILLEKNKNFEFEIFEINKKEKNGKLQCDKYTELKKDSFYVYYYGPNFNELLAFLNKTNVKRVNISKKTNNYYILNINNINNNIKIDSIYNIIKKKLINYYNLKEDISYKKEKEITLIINNYNKIKKFIDTSRTETYYKIMNEKIIIKNMNFYNVTKALNDYYYKDNIVTNNQDTFNLSITFKTYNNINRFLNALKEFGITYDENLKEYKYYYYK